MKNKILDLIKSAGLLFLIFIIGVIGFETTQTKKDNGFVEFKPKNFVVHLK